MYHTYLQNPIQNVIENWVRLLFKSKINKPYIKASNHLRIHIRQDMYCLILFVLFTHLYKGMIWFFAVSCDYCGLCDYFKNKGINHFSEELVKYQEISLFEETLRYHKWYLLTYIFLCGFLFVYFKQPEFNRVKYLSRNLVR